MPVGVIQSGKNKNRFKKTKPKGGGKANRFSGCEATQKAKGKSADSAAKICAFIAKRKKGG